MDYYPDINRPSSTLSAADHAYDDHDTLDGAFMDQAIMSPTASQNDLFSPDSTLWEDFSERPFAPHGLPNVQTNPFLDHSAAAATSNNPFTRLGASQAASYGQHQSLQQAPANPWPASDANANVNAGSRTPTSARPFHVDAFAPEFDPASTASFMAAAPAVFSTANVKPSSVFPPTQVDNPSRPLSPHNHKEWMEMAAQENQPRPGPKRVRASSPPRPFSPFPRRDGIRKKNARFEIPAERSLLNIDQLIANAANDDEVKELKQQKRLLRNRQAALDSRQRKKKHTEELEEEKKHFTERIGMLEEELANMRLQMDGCLQEKEGMHMQHMEQQQIIQRLTWDKEELVCSHTQETGELRKKISVLTDKLESSSNHMSVAHTSTAFADFASEMDNLHMGSADWENYIFVDNFGIDPEQAPQQAQRPQETTTLVVPQRKKDVVFGEDKPVASGLLFMLLLCGAFVASKSSGTSAPPLPRMPDEVRAASATVLDSILKDASIASTADPSLVINHMEALEPTPSGSAWPNPSMAVPTFGHSQDAMSNLDHLHSHLARPSKDQEAEQVFSMTASQYNSLTSADFGRRVYNIDGEDMTNDVMSPTSQPSHHRRNLAETLAAMREQNKGDTAAEIYTRSLLWDRIPGEVVREFKRIVEESDRLSGESTQDDCENEDMKCEITA